MTLLFIVLVLFSCQKEKDNEEEKESASNGKGLKLNDITLAPKPVTDRWYFQEQVSRGKVLFQKNCVVCHGANAEATPDWRTPDANGFYPPPPLNGSAHTWHHPLIVLASTVYDGGQPVGGQMPAFKGQLSESEIVDIIASFQSYWSDEIYQRWLQIENSSRQ